MRISDWSSDVCSSDLLGPDDAAILEYDPAGAGYAAVQLTEWLYRSRDYHRIQSSLTAAQSAIDRDGRIRLVIARRDPGVWNWLDTGGHEHVFSILRRSEEHTSELQSLMRISYAVFCLKKKKEQKHTTKSRIQ